jgi:Skp family chaperone for outer membrane proteins
MTKTTVLILFVLFTLSIPAYGADLKIAYLDFNRALNESEQGKKATAMLEEMIRDKKTAVIEKEEEIKKLDEELKKQLSILSPETAQEEGYTIVFERGVSGILYFQKHYDITDKVIEKYNESVKEKK